ncbi:MAG: O-antigen ligase family protein [Candidatus Sericytochromatia bacterium]
MIQLIYLAILLLPINLTLSGILLISFIISVIYKSKITNFILIDKKYYYLYFSFILVSIIQLILVNHPFLHFIGFIGHYFIYLLLYSSLNYYFKNKFKTSYGVSTTQEEGVGGYAPVTPETPERSSEVFSNNNQLILSSKFNQDLPKYLIYSGFILSIIGMLSFFNLISSFKLFKYNIYGAEEYLLNFQLYEGINKASSFNMNPNIMSIYLIITFFMTLFFIKEKKDFKIKYYFYEIALFTQFLAIFMTKSRGGILTLILGLIFLFLLYFKKYKLSKYYFYLFTLFLPFLIFNFNAYKELILSIFDFSNHSNYLRIETWKIISNIILDFPNGIGILNYDFVYPAYKPKTLQYIPHAHNWILQTTLESGILGALLLFLAYFKLILSFYKEKYHLGFLILILFFTFNLTDYTLNDTRICILLIFLIFYKNIRYN